MKLIDQIRRQPLFVSFGRSSGEGGFVNVELAASRTGNSVSITAADGSVAPIDAANATDAGVMSAADKNKLDGIPPGLGNPIEFTSRSAVGAENIGAAIAHLRTSGFLTVGDGGGALYRRVGAEPVHALKVQSADSAWWELVPGSHIDVRQAGAKGDGVTDDSQAFLDALAFASLNATANDNATFGVVVPPSDSAYYLGTTTLELKRTIHLIGQNGGQSGAKACKLLWDANVTGIIVHRHNTIDATTESDPNQLSADGSLIQGLHLESAGGTIAGVTDGTKGHGIWLRARATLRDLTVTGFPGNGIHIVASSGGAANVEGNANSWAVEHARIIQCHQNGIFLDGADVNAGVGSHIDATSNGRWGIWDSSFLGNTWVACHSRGNGAAGVGENGPTESSIVTYGGDRYFANADATEVDLVATTPGTNEDVWVYLEAAGTGQGIVTWQASQPVGTYFVGGPYRTDNANGRSVIAGCYWEGGQGRPQLVDPTLVLGGNVADGYHGHATGIAGDGELRGVLSVHNQRRHNPDRDLTLVLNPSDNKLMKLDIEGDHASGTNVLAWDESTGQILFFEHGNLSARRPLRLTTDLNTKTYGRSSALDGGEVVFPKGIWIGDSEGRVRYFGGFNSKSSGERGRGDLDLNYNPSQSGQVLGWRCITAGTIGSGGVLEDLYAAPTLPTNRGAVLKPHASSDKVEWAAAAKAGTATIADTTSSKAVTFSTAFNSTNYAVALSKNGDEGVWVTNKATTGFTLNRTGTSGARSVDWTATPHENR